MKIEVTTKPNKTNYLAGDSFNSAGMVITASYGTGQTVLATAEVSRYSVSPSVLTDDTTSVTISYSEGGKTCTTTLAVTVMHKLTAIAITTKPNKLTYEYGDTLATAGMVVTASYSDSQTKTVTDYSCSPTIFSTVGNKVVIVNYTENGVSQTATFNVTVNRKSIPKPTWKSNLIYNGNRYSASNPNYWNNYNTSYMIIGGTRFATDAGTYIITFTPRGNYRWTDGTTTAIDVNWTIDKATGSLSVNPTAVALNRDNYNSGVAVTITRAGDGAISYSPTSISGLTLSLSGNTLTIKGNGSTSVSVTTTITIKVAAGTNYTAPSNKTITVSAEYWSWGSETATGDAVWWAGLKNWITNASTNELAACVGKTKSVTLTSAVQGTTTHLVRCIGYNCDRDKSNTSRNTLTFHTKNCLANTTKFSNSNTLWTDSTVRSLCANYYNAFPGKASIVTVSKGTATTTNSSQSATSTYQDETVFLPSDCEMGFSKGADYSNGKGYAASYDEFCQQNTSKTAYQYYTSDNSRIKYTNDSSSSTQYYWERSLYFDSTNFVSMYYACAVYFDGKPLNAGYNGNVGFAPAFVI